MKSNGLYKKDKIVLYHANCNDGFGGAWAAWKKLGSKADYVAVYRQEDPPSIVGKEVYTIDYTYPEDITRKLISENKKVIALDHHHSTEKATKLSGHYMYDNNHSGAVLAWKYFHPNKQIPKFLEMIEDVDLWKFKIPNSKEVYTYIDLFDKDFKVWEKLIRKFDTKEGRKEIIIGGSAIIRYEDKAIKKIIDSNSRLVKFLKYKVLAVNSANFSNLNSQIGHELVQKRPPIGIIWFQKNGKFIVSLRSNGKVDVSKIAKKFGGGGLKSAAAFNVKSFDDLPFKFIKND